MNNAAAATKKPATLATTDRGVSRGIWTIQAGDYIWHKGAFRLVTSAEGWTLRMGRHVLHSSCSTVEAAA